MIRVTERRHRGPALVWTARDRADFIARATWDGTRGPDAAGNPDADYDNVVEWLAGDLAALEIEETPK